MQLFKRKIKPTPLTEYLSIGQAFYLLCLKRDIFGATPYQHTAQERWRRSGKSGIVLLPRLGFEAWEEYMTARQMADRHVKSMAYGINIEIHWTLADVERVWEEGVDRTQA